MTAMEVEEVGNASGEAGRGEGAGRSGGGTQPWVEKYRPRRVEDVSSQEDVIATLKKAMDTANVRAEGDAGPTRAGPARRGR